MPFPLAAEKVVARSVPAAYNHRQALAAKKKCSLENPGS
jgi:hypothetical protein